MGSLFEKLSRGVFWNFVDTIGTQLVGFIVSMFLARLLSAQDFGVLVLVNVFIIIAQVFAGGGMYDALIVKSNIEHKYLNSAFFFNLFISILVYLILFFVAPSIAKFYSNDELVLVIRVLGLSVIFSSICIVQTAIILKNVNFKQLFKLKLPAIIVSSIVGIVLAYQGLGYWALVIQNLILNGLIAVFLWVYSDWKPNISFDFSAFFDLFNFSYKLLLSSIVDRVFEGFYPIVIAKYMTPSILAYYNRGNSLKDLIVYNLVTVITRVSLPILVELRSDKSKLKLVYQKIIQMTFFVLTPMLFGGVICSENLIVTLYSDKWIPSIPFFQLACLLGLMYPWHYINLDILKVYGRTDLFFVLEIIKKLLIVLALYFTIGYSVYVLIYGQIVVSLIALFLNSFFSGLLIKYSFFEQVKDIFEIILLSFVMALFVYLSGFIELKPQLLIFVQILIGISVYLLGAYFLKLKPFVYSLEIIRLKLKR